MLIYHFRLVYWQEESVFNLSSRLPRELTSVIFQQMAAPTRLLRESLFKAKSVQLLRKIGQMGVYAGLGVSQAVGFFLMGLLFSLLTYFASRELHRASIQRVMHAPMSFFETTVSSMLVFFCHV